MMKINRDRLFGRIKNVCHLVTFILFGLVLTNVRIANAQDSTRNVLPDSIEIVTISHYSKLETRNSSAYVRKFDCATTLSTSSGISIFNALRGRVPGLTVPSYFAIANSSGLRTGPFPFVNDALIVIDGVPFNNFIGQYANLNAFDYSSIAVFSNTSALNFLGGANSGAFVLTSKSGEGVVGPLFEFNAYATYAWAELNNPLTNQMVKVNEWYMANALAYSQDFGKIDTRISYTAQKKFSESFGEPLIHYLKANTGFVVNSKLDLRLIVDGRFSKYDDTIPFGTPPVTINESKSETFVNANVMAKYNLTSALAITSQVGISSYHSNLTLTGPSSGNTSETANTFSQANLVIRGSRTLGKKAALSGFAGYQLFDQSIKQASGSEKTDRYPFFMGHVMFSYDKRLNVSASYRDGTQSNSSSSSPTASASSLASSLIFTGWIGKSFLSLGKIRVATGSHTVVPYNSYPPPDPQYVLFPDGRGIPYDVKNLESGIDMGFLQSRLNVTLNYYQNAESYTANSSGVSRYLNHGWEADLRFGVVKKPDLNFDTGLVLSNATTRFDIGAGTGQESNPYLRMGWLNQLKLKSIRISFLIESYSNYTGYASNTGFVNSSFTVLRDISLGISLPNGFIGLGTRSTTLSIIGRNLIKNIGSGPDLDVASGLSVFQKSASLNLNVTF